jgi:glycosyltransferase involved in cell wall biosynthesis
MFPSGMDHRKNNEIVIKAFSKLKSSILSEHTLAVVCKLNSTDKVRLFNMCKRYKVQDRAVFTGYVDDEEMVLLYNAAECVIFPSLYEGFGLPIVEAFACGTPVITSNVASMPEAAGDSAILVDPKDVKGLTTAMEDLLLDVDLQTSLINKGFQQVKKFSWENVAKSTLDAYCDVIRKKTEIFVHSKSKDKIAYFTPLPPQHSGISEYSEELLPELSRYFDIDVYLDGFNTDSKRLLSINRINFLKLKSFKKYHKKYKCILYHIGNSDYHRSIYKLALAYPGLVVLHDYVIAGMLHKHMLDTGSNELVLDAFNIARNTHSIFPSFEGWLSRLNLASVYNLSLNDSLLEKARAVAVHSYWAKEKICQKFPELPVFHIPMGVNSQYQCETDNEKNIYNNFGLNKSDFIIGVFGHITFTKRIEIILKAFAQFSPNNPNSKLILVGKVHPPNEPWFPDVKKMIINLGIERSVICSGFVDMSTFIHLVSSVDLAINLRYPSAGETSAALIRLLFAGKPCIITAMDQYNEFPDDCCWKLIPDNEFEVDILAEYLKELAGNSELVTTMGKTALKYARINHDIKNMVQGYVNSISGL